MALFSNKVNLLEHRNLFINGVEALEKEILDKSKILSVEMRSKALGFIEELEETIGKHISACEQGEKMAEKLIALMEKYEIVKNIEFQQTEDKKYSITINQCAFITNDSHPRLNADNRICPFAMMISAIIKCTLKTEDVIVEPTNFTPHSSKTRIDVL